MRRLLALPVAVMFSTCFPQAELAQCYPRAPRNLPALAGPVLHPGEDVSMAIAYLSGTVCPDSSRAIIDTVRVELTGPDNLPIDVSATAPLMTQTGPGSTGDRWESTLRFTPLQAGSHHLIASFEPQGGLLTLDLWVSQDHRLDVPTATALTKSADCFRIERTRQGSDICSTYDARVVRFQGGVVSNNWAGASVRVDGDAIWLNASSRLFRYLELPDGGLESTSLTAEIGPTFWASENELLHWVRDTANHVRFDGAALATVGRVPNLPLSVEAVAVDVTSNSIVAATLQSWARFPLDVAVDGGVLFAEGEGATHQDRDGLWLEDVSGASPGAFRFAPADTRKPLLELQPPAGWLTPSRPWTTVFAGERPLFFPRRAFDPQETAPQLDFTEVLVPVVRGEGIELWHFVAPEGSNFSDVTGGMLRATRAGGEHLFFPVTP